MKAKRLGATVAVFGMALSLAACWGEPSAENIKQATNKNERFGFMLSMLIGAGTPRGQNVDAVIAELKKNAVVDKSGCVQAQGAPGYICDYRFGRKLPSGEISYSPPMKGRFFQSGGEWVAELN